MSSPVVDFIVNTIYNGLEYFNKYYSKYRAYVIDNEDPNKEGRLKIIVPGIIDEPMDYWAPSSGIFSGSGYGFHFIPPKHSLVWVSFENGNPNFPVWGHGYFGKGEIPEGKSDVGNYWIATPNGHSIEMDDSLGSIKITHNKGDVVILNDKGISFQSDKIFLGTLDKGKEPAVMGDSLEKSLKEINEQITDLVSEVKAITDNVDQTLSQLIAPTDLTNPYTSALAANISVQTTALSSKLSTNTAKLETINKSISSINEGLDKIKSKKIMLDYD